MNDRAPRDNVDGPLPTVVLVRDSTRSVPAHVRSLREAVLIALAGMEAPLVLTADHALQHYVERIDPSSRVVVIADTAESLQVARSLTGGGRDVTYCVLVVPTSFAAWRQRTTEWARGLEAAVGDSAVYLTDSSVSRAILEEHLAAARVDVRVVAPVDRHRTSEPGEFSAQFESMKHSSSGASVTWLAGTNWDFSEREVVDAKPPATVDRAKVTRLNIEVLRPILAGKRLPGEPLRIGVLGHKLSFIDELARDLARSSGSSVVLDDWKNLGAPSDVVHSRQVLAQSDVVIGEWGRPNNVWIQNNATRDKRLIVRVHRYEVTTEFPRAIDMDRYDAGVVIVPWVGRALVQKFNWPAEKLVYIPNYVNTHYFWRPKLPGAEFCLGIVGITPDLKRLDLALDLLAELRSVDLRYSLRVRGQLPTAHIHWATNPALAEQWGAIEYRLRSDPILRNAVYFDSPGRDMAAWFEGVGVILSTSDLEGSHVALAEGMASGALPIARPWPGVRTLWPAEAVFDTLDRAVEQILRSRDPRWREETVAAFLAHPSLDQHRVLRAWWHLVRGDSTAAQSAFGPVDWSAPWYEPIDF